MGYMAGLDLVKLTLRQFYYRHLISILPMLRYGRGTGQTCNLEDEQFAFCCIKRLFLRDGHLRVRVTFTLSRWTYETMLRLKD